MLTQKPCPPPLQCAVGLRQNSYIEIMQINKAIKYSNYFLATGGVVGGRIRLGVFRWPFEKPESVVLRLGKCGQKNIIRLFVWGSFYQFSFFLKVGQYISESTLLKIHFHDFY